MTETKGRLSGHARRQRGAASDLAEAQAQLNELDNGGLLLRFAEELLAEAMVMIESVLRELTGEIAERIAECRGTERVERKDDDT